MSEGKARPGKREGLSKAKSREGEGSKGSPKAESAYTELFREYREELDASHDKHECLVKLSRDCTIHSKRAIFTLHQFSGDDENKDSVLSEAEAKINKDILPILHSIALKINVTDPHKHHRAYSPGVQEFIEALAYYTYLKSGQLISFEEAQKFLTFQSKEGESVGSEEVEKSDPSKDELADKEEASGNIDSTESPNRSKCRNTVLPLVLSDFVLGLADLTGELMRLCINAVGTGNRDLPFTLLPFFRALFSGFHFFGPGLKHMNQKMTVLRSSLAKVENVCYTLKVRGSEMPKQALMDVINTTAHQED